MHSVCNKRLLVCAGCIIIVFERACSGCVLPCCDREHTSGIVELVETEQRHQPGNNSSSSLAGLHGQRLAWQIPLPPLPAASSSVPAVAAVPKAPDSPLHAAGAAGNQARCNGPPHEKNDWAPAVRGLKVGHEGAEANRLAHTLLVDARRCGAGRGRVCAERQGTLSACTLAFGAACRNRQLTGCGLSPQHGGAGSRSLLRGRLRPARARSAGRLQPTCNPGVACWPQWQASAAAVMRLQGLCNGHESALLEQVIRVAVLRRLRGLRRCAARRYR